MPESGLRLRRLTWIAALAVYLLIVIGGLVRITGSGLGCPDWPLCHGRVIPPLEKTALIEYTHRLAASAAGLLLMALSAAAWRQAPRHPWLRPLAIVIPALLVIQIPLGGVIVETEVSPLAVSVHLGMALLIFGATLLAAVAASAPHPQAGGPPRYRLLLTGTLLALFLLLLSGALVVGSGAGQVCPGWPLCGGAADTTPAAAIAMYHRALVFGVALLIGVVVLQTLRLDGASASRLRRWALILAVLFGAQVGIGALQVVLDFPTAWRLLHLAAGVGVWGALTVMTGLTWLGWRVSATQRSGRGAPLAAASGK
jgi:heme A synthase